MRPGIHSRIWPKVNKTKTCWLWIGLRNSKGYGRIYYQKKHWILHRLVWELMREEIPPGMCALHKCDVPNCVNPDHLFIGTPQDNIDDKMRKGRWYGGERAKIPREKLAKAIAEIENGKQQKIVADLYGISASYLSNIRTGYRQIKQGKTNK